MWKVTNVQLSVSANYVSVTAEHECGASEIKCFGAGQCKEGAVEDWLVAKNETHQELVKTVAEMRRKYDLLPEGQPADVEVDV